MTSPRRIPYVGEGDGEEVDVSEGVNDGVSVKVLVLVGLGEIVEVAINSTFIGGVKEIVAVKVGLTPLPGFGVQEIKRNAMTQK